MSTDTIQSMLNSSADAELRKLLAPMFEIHANLYQSTDCPDVRVQDEINQDRIAIKTGTWPLAITKIACDQAFLHLRDAYRTKYTSKWLAKIAELSPSIDEIRDAAGGAP